MKAISAKVIFPFTWKTGNHLIQVDKSFNPLVDDLEKRQVFLTHIFIVKSYHIRIKSKYPRNLLLSYTFHILRSSMTFSSEHFEHSVMYENFIKKPKVWVVILGPSPSNFWIWVTILKSALNSEENLVVLAIVDPRSKSYAFHSWRES